MLSKKLRVTALALAALMVLFAFSSCGGSSNNGGNDSTTAGPAATTAGDTSSTQLSANVPAADYGGATFMFLAHEQSATNNDWLTTTPRELVADTETGDLINDAVYKRNSVIAQQYNIVFKETDNTDEVGQLKKSVQAGDNAYDCAIMYNNNVPTAITANVLMDVSNLKYIDLSQPWWDQAANGLTIDHKMYVLAGALTILDKEATSCIYFNKDLLQSLGLSSPYDLVTAGNWTFDQMSQMMKGVSLDLNGDGKMDTNDRFGFLTYNDTLHAMLVSGGGALATKDANDEPVMSLATPQNVAIGSAAMTILYDKSNVYNMQTYSDSSKWITLDVNMFSNSQALFMWGRISLAELMRDITTNFGIVPMPKYDASQPNYLSVVNPYTGVMIGVPKTCPDTDKTSAILEALSCESLYTLQPAFYDQTLQRKLTRDTESSAMLDVIFANKVYDIGAVYAFGNAFLGYIGLYGTTCNTDIASYFAKNQNAMNTAIAKTVAMFQSNT